VAAGWPFGELFWTYDYDRPTKRYFNVRSQADTSLLHVAYYMELKATVQKN